MFRPFKKKITVTDRKMTFSYL